MSSNLGLRGFRRNTRSGGTIRAKNFVKRKSYFKEGLVVRSTITDQHGASGHEYTDNMAGADVPLSLNKKGRWKLQEEVKDSVDSELVSDNVKVTVVERHKLLRSSDCTKYYTNIGHTLEKQPRRTRYINAASLKAADRLPAKQVYSRRRRHRSDNDFLLNKSVEDEDADDGIDVRINYEFLLPCPKTSAAFNAKSFEPSLAEQGVVRGGKKRRSRCANLNLDDEPALPDDSLDNIAEEEHTDHSSPDTEALLPVELDHPIPPSPTLNVTELIECALNDLRKMDRPKAPKKRTSSSDSDALFSPKSKVFHGGAPIADTKSAERPLDVALSNQTEDTCDLLPVIVAIRAVCVTPAALTANFNGDYMEATCLPRKFTIDISGRVESALQNLFITRPVAHLDLEAYLLVEVIASGKYCCGSVIDVLKPESIDDICYLRVCLNANLSVTRLLISTLNDCTVYESFEDVIQATVNYLKTLPEDCFLNDDRRVSAIGQKPQLFRYPSLVSRMSNWDLSANSPVNLALDRQREEEVKKASFQRQLSRLEKTFQSSDPFCNICCEPVNLFNSTDREEDEEYTQYDISRPVPGFCLLECSHCFCQECWKTYFISQIKSGRANILCPEYKCASLVDLTTLLSTVPLKFYRMHINHVAELGSKESNAQWCPNASCGKLLTIRYPVGGSGPGEQSIPPFIICDCGYNSCLSCSKDAHWPATCTQAEKYADKLKSAGYNASTSKECIAVVKRCPRCRQPVEKDGGCPHMTCSKCNFDYCWGCLEEWTVDHWWRPCAFLPESQQTFDLEFIDTRRLAVSSENKYYAQSLDHRDARSGEKQKLLRKKANGLMKMLFHKRPSDEVTSDSLREIVTVAINLKFQCHLVAEHSILLLSGLDRNKNLQAAVKRILTRMTFVCNRLEQVIESSDRLTSAVSVRSRLLALINSGKACLENLVSLLNKIKPSK